MNKRVKKGLRLLLYAVAAFVVGELTWVLSYIPGAFFDAVPVIFVIAGVVAAAVLVVAGLVSIIWGLIED